MRKVRYFLLGGIIGGALLIVACTPRTHVTASWSSPQAAELGFNNVLVAVMVENVNVKQSVERTIVQELREQGITATPSLDVFPPRFSQELAERDDIMQVIRDNGYDAIVTVALIDTETETRYVPGQRAYAPSRYHPFYGRFYGYYSHWFPRIYEPGYYQQDRTYFYETNFYDAQSEELVWSAQSESMDPARAERFARQFATTIVNEMTDDNILAAVN